jgi:hypothetical protein
VAVKQITKQLLALVETRYGYAEPVWTRAIRIDGDDDFPILELPVEQLRYSTQRGYPMTFAATACDRRTLLIAQVESFDIAKHAGAGWAIPAAYTPTTDDQRLSQALEFDEGWEDAEFECGFACDDRFAAFWRAAVDRARFGLTVRDAASIYPVALGERELEPIAAALAAWTN